MTDAPIDWLLFPDLRVILAFAHLCTLFMAAPIFNAMMRIGTSLIEAAHGAGASDPQISWNVIVPLCKTGIMIGALFEVTLVMGDVITVRIMFRAALADHGVFVLRDRGVPADGAADEPAAGIREF